MTLNIISNKATEYSFGIGAGAFLKLTVKFPNWLTLKVVDLADFENSATLSC
jgi:hypothetical protein